MAALIFYSDHKNFFVSIIQLFCLVIIHMFNGMAILISFKSIFFAFRTWLTGARCLAFVLPQILTYFPQKVESFLKVFTIFKLRRGGEE